MRRAPGCTVATMGRRAVVVVVMLCALAGCGGGSSSDADACERAWDAGLGNAGQPGVDRAGWLADCRAESKP